MANSILNKLIAHSIINLEERQVGFGKTKLVKLLYLIDVENYRRRRRTLTGLEWQFYHYGPYAFAFDEALEDLEFDIPQESIRTGNGRDAIVFRLDWNIRSRLGSYIESAELSLVNRILREWGEVELNPLLDHVYFNTEPMREAKRGEILDFSTIQPRRVQRSSRDATQMTADRLAEYRTRFKESMAGRESRSLNPPPRLDEVFHDALARMNREEGYEIPHREVDISNEAKAHIRDQWDG